MEIYRWVETALAQMRFPPDRNAVRQELWDHMLDRREVFLAQGMNMDEAEAEAARVMGDPVETGRLLNRIHRPWLGWLWQASRGLLIAAVVLAVILGVNHERNSYIDWSGMLPRPDRNWDLDGCFYDLAQYLEEETQTVTVRPGAVERAGVYTLELDHGSWVKGETHQRLTLGFRVKSKNPLDLDPRGFGSRLLAEDDLGNVYAVLEREDPAEVYASVFAVATDLDWRDPYLHLCFDAEDGMERQWIRFYVPDTTFDITIDAEGRLIP